MRRGPIQAGAQFGSDWELYVGGEGGATVWRKRNANAGNECSDYEIGRQSRAVLDLEVRCRVLARGVELESGAKHVSTQHASRTVGRTRISPVCPLPCLAMLSAEREDARNNGAAGQRRPSRHRSAKNKQTKTAHEVLDAR